MNTSGTAHQNRIITADTADAAVQQRRTDLLGRLDAAAHARVALGELRVRVGTTQPEIEVVVSGRGTLLELSLGASTSGLARHELAAAIVSTVHRACTRAAEQATTLLGPALPAGTDLDDLVRDPALPPAPAVAAGSAPARVDELGEPDTWLQPVQGGGAR